MEFADSKEALLRKPTRTGNKRIIATLVALCCVFAGGILVGRFVLRSEKIPVEPSISDKIIQDGDPKIGEDIISQISSDNIRMYLRELSELPHLAGTETVHEQGRELKTFWLDNGLDEVYLTSYDVLLSYPNTTDPENMNRLFVYNETDDIEWQSDLFEPILHPSENKSNVVPPFNAYSAPGDINSTDLVYANYGRLEDFQWLTKNSYSVQGKIVLARYGKIFRGDKVKLAWQNGAIGIILYSDPADYAMEGVTSNVYPHSLWLPPSGSQRGTVLMGFGDPLTPGYPATEEAYRIDENNPDTGLAKIPVHPIGYGVAKTLLQFMDGDEVPTAWRGDLNITYRIGGKLSNNRTLRMRISTKNYRRTTYNAIGIIRGEFEPDRYVILGAHRDAWVFGAIDNSGGTAVLKEVSRVMGNMVQSGKWRPRRTILFCSWGSEEYGIIGSTEWVEQYVKSLSARAVAYLNVDTPVRGTLTMSAAATPLLMQPFFDATKKIQNPEQAEVAAGVTTVYDKMMRTIPAGDHPIVPPLGSGSDYTPFVQRVGLPSLHLMYTYDPRLGLSSYPLYHSKYETFYAVDNFLDKGFKYHRAIGQTWAEMSRNLADSLIIPFEIDFYATKVHDMITDLDSQFGGLMRRYNISLDSLYRASQSFTNEINSFKQRMKNLDRNDPFAIRRMNDQIMQLGKNFIDPAGLPGRPLYRHMLFAPSSVDTYHGSTFPGIVDTLFEIEGSADEDEKWETLKKHLSVIIFSIESAASSLRDVTNFMQ